MSKEVIVSKTYDLLKTAIPMLNKLPRNFKFTLGDRMQNSISDLLELVIEAVYTQPENKLPLLFKINILLEKLRHYFRLCFDLGLYSSLVYHQYAERIDEIGRMVGGWIKSLRPK